MKFYSNNYEKLMSLILQKQIKAVLLHGPNYGYIHKIYSDIKNKLNAFAVNILYKELNADKLRMLSNNINFFKQKEIIRITDIQNTINNDLKKFFLNEDYEHLICITHNDNLPASGIRKFFEDSEKLASVGCYFEEAKEIKVAIYHTLKENKKQMTNDALQFLYHNLYGDYQFIRNELSKLMIYTHDKQQISLDDVRESLIQSDISSGDEACFFYATKNYKSFLDSFSKLLASGVNEILIIRALLRFYVTIYITKSRVLSGQNLDSVMKKLTPPIFFKFTQLFRQIIEEISLQEIIDNIALFQEMEINYKSNPSCTDILLSRFTKLHF